MGERRDDFASRTRLGGRRTPRARAGATPRRRRARSLFARRSRRLPRTTAWHDLGIRRAVRHGDGRVLRADGRARAFQRGDVGAWILVTGVLRYVYVLVRAFVPARRPDVPRSRFGRLAFTGLAFGLFFLFALRASLGTGCCARRHGARHVIVRALVLRFVREQTLNSVSEPSRRLQVRGASRQSKSTSGPSSKRA